jgi:hypothetical protein
MPTRRSIYSYTIVKSDCSKATAPSWSVFSSPQEIAEKVCVAYLSEGGSLVGSTSDGLDSDLGFVVFVKAGSGQLYLCNATGAAALWAFEAVSEPITFDGKPEVT